MKFNLLTNFVDASAKTLNYLIRNKNRIETFLDSGAYVAWSHGKGVDLDVYCDFCENFGDRFYAYAALDVIGDKAASFKNYEVMARRGLRGIVTHTPGMDLDDDIRRLFDYSDYIAVGGWTSFRMFPKHVIAANLARVRRVVDLCQEADKKVHVFGFFNTATILEMRPTSFDWSVFSLRGKQAFVYAREVPYILTLNPSVKAKPWMLKAMHADGINRTELRDHYKEYSFYSISAYMIELERLGIKFFCVCDVPDYEKFVYNNQRVKRFRRFGDEVYSSFVRRTG